MTNSGSFSASIDKGTENSTLTSAVNSGTTNYLCYDITQNGDNVTFTLPRYAGIMAALLVSNKYYYYVVASDGTASISTLETGSVEIGGNKTISYPQCILKGQTLYKIANNSEGDWFRKTITPNQVLFTETLNYTSETINNVAYYTEGEDIASMNTATYVARASKGAMGYTGSLSTYVNVTSLFPGRYYIYTRGINGNQNERKVSFKVGATEVFPTNYPNGTNTLSNSEQFTVSNSSILSVACEGSSASGMDWMYVLGQPISFPITSGTMSQLSSMTVTVYNASASTTYTSSNTSIAKVVDNGDGTIKITSGTTNGTATITATENGNTATYTVTVETGTLAFNKSSQTVYLEDLTCLYTATSSSNAEITYSVPAGNGVAYVLTGDAHTGVLHFVSTGSVTVTATDARNLTATYTLNVSTRQTLNATSLTTGQTFDVGTQVGQLTDESVTIDGATLYFGAGTGNNGRAENQVVRSIRGGYGLTCIDVNGYTFGNIVNFAADNSEQYGTYYRLDTGSEVNTIIITGYFSDDVSHLYLYDTTGKKLLTLQNTGANLASLVMDGSVLQPNSTYYLYSPSYSVFALKSFTHTNVKATLDYADSFEGVVFCGDELAAPTLTITDASGNDISSHYTKGSFYSSKTSVATVNSSTGALTTLSAVGRTIINLPLTSDSPATYPNLVVTDTIDVTDGVWEFTRYDRDHGTYLMYGSTGWTGEYGDRNMARDNKDFEFILMNQEFTARHNDTNPAGGWDRFNYGEPLPLATGLRTRYKQRLINGGNGHISDYAGGQLHLFGRGTTGSAAASAWGHGGEVMVPVKKEMLIEINCWSDDALSEMEIEGAYEVDGKTNAQYFYVNPGTAQTFQFIAKEDGFVYIKNPSINLDLHINYIKVLSSLVFADGNETYVLASSGAYVNPIENLGEASVSSYSYENKTNEPVTAINSTTGTVSLGGAYGTFEVTAVASDNRRGTYKATALALEMQDLETTISGDTHVFDLLTAVKTLDTGNSFGDDKTTAENAIKAKIVFTVEDETAVSTLSGTNLTVEGAGVVTLKAKLGSIEQTFRCTVTGGALGYNDGTADIACPNPVIKNTEESYTIKIIGSGSNPKFNVKAMYDAILGEKLIANKSSLTFKDAADNTIDVTSSALTNSETLTISGFNTIQSTVGDEFGGVIPIYASYEYGSPAVEHQLVGTLTVAYAKHTWNFQSNMTSELADWYVNKSTNTKEGKWQSTATFDMPTDEDDETFATGVTESHSDTHDWKFVRKIGGTHRESAIIYYYNHNVENTNALVIPKTEGLHIHSTKNGQQLGVEMTAERVTRKPNGNNDKYRYGWGMAVAYNANGTRYVEYPIVENGSVVNSDQSDHFVYDAAGDASHTAQYLSLDTGKKYNCSNLMVKRGGKITIPKVKPEQWIEVRWTRHQDDMAERIIMNNLCDVDGNYISQVYKIGNCFYNLDWSSSTYMLQVAPEGTPRGDGTTVTTDADGCVDVTFEIADNIYISIQQIELHEPEWSPISSIVEQLNGYDDTITPSYTSKDDAPKVKWQYIWDDDANSHTVTFLSKEYQNAPNAPQTWTFEMDDMLKREGAKMTYTDDMDREATLTYKGGWGKVTITMTSYSQNMKYVANKKSWTITFGQAPRQTYPYTWDFTKYFKSTKDNIGSDSWTSSGSEFTADYTNYDTQNYTKSYYVEGGQLVSYALRNTNNGVLRETEGLGFKMDTSTTPDATPDATLNINMTNGDVANTGQSAKSATGDSYQTWEATSSHLSIGAGGKIIVPKPNDNTNYGGYYIYINSSVKPSSVANAEEVTGSDVNSGKNQYKYHFTANDNAEFTFSSDADIYAIGVTNEFKEMTPLSGTAWATESRSHAVDYTLDSLLTVNPVHAYAIIERSGNPKYSDDKTKTVVAVNDRRHVVPANNGLVLKQTTNVPTLVAPATTYQVPLFAPAVTTAEDAGYRFTGNLMRPCVSGKPFMSETENLDGTDYTVFILANKYMTWKKEGTNTTYDEHFTEGNVAAFYRMHIFNDNSYDSGTDRNTLGRNKAYLLLRTDKINGPIWETSPASPAPRYVGIAGVSDMEEEQSAAGIDQGDGRTYNLRGQAVDGESLSPGIYIKNGKKIVMK